jgi:hypothetical protein
MGSAPALGRGSAAPAADGLAANGLELPVGDCPYRLSRVRPGGQLDAASRRPRNGAPARTRMQRFRSPVGDRRMPTGEHVPPDRLDPDSPGSISTAPNDDPETAAERCHESGKGHVQPPRLFAVGRSSRATYARDLPPSTQRTRVARVGGDGPRDQGTASPSGLQTALALMVRVAGPALEDRDRGRDRA